MSYTLALMMDAVRSLWRTLATLHGITAHKIVHFKFKEIIPHDQSILKICIPHLQSCNQRSLSSVYTKCPRL
jgi:hypothetical protein